MQASKRSTILVRALLGIGVLAVATEVGLRVILGLGHPVLFVPDPRFGYFPKGDQRLHRFFVDININQFGMRSDPTSATKGPGEYRILFVGDSVPYGTTFVDQREIFVEKIAASVGHSHPSHVSVLNASSPGWAPSNELGFMQARGLYDADMVVMVYNTKDLTQPFSSYQESPLTPLRNPPTAMGELWSRYVKPRIFPAIAAVDPGSTSDIGRPSLADEARVLATIEATRQFVVAHGARFVILFSPAVTADIRETQNDWDQAVTKLRSLTTHDDIPLIDLTDVLGARDPRRVYFDGIHLRPLGNQLVADAFTSWFEQHH